MSTLNRPPHSTRLENLRLEGDRAWLELEGEQIELTRESAAPAVQSFQAFYQAAYQAYHSQPEPRQLDSPAPWWRRLRGWLTQWIGSMRMGAGRALGPATAAPPLPRTPPPASVTPHAPAEPAPATIQAPPAAAIPRPLVRPAPAASVTRPSPATVSAVPRLRAAFADDKGVHLIWQQPSARGAAVETERIYPFDSPVAAGLQACYGQLAELGHAVVDLAAWQPKLAVRVKAEHSVAVREGAVAPGLESASSPEGRAPPKAEPARLMRLTPERSDIASRLVVIPAEGDPKPEVITGPETFFNALHAAADAAIPESERLTFLKCRQVKGELKVVELGFGRQADGAEPARTETAAAWWKQAQKIRAADAKAPDAAAPEPAAVRQVELFGK